jgi:hypothetical protein
MATAGIPFLPSHWYYNTETGQLASGNNLENLGNNLLGGMGWHELNISGSATGAQAAAAAKKEFPAGTAPDYSPVTAGKVAKTAAQEAGAALPAWRLVFGNTGGLLGRILKVVIGAVLLLSGILRLTGADKTAMGIAGKAAVLA